MLDLLSQITVVFSMCILEMLIVKSRQRFGFYLQSVENEQFFLSVIRSPLTIINLTKSFPVNSIFNFFISVC